MPKSLRKSAGRTRSGWLLSYSLLVLLAQPLAPSKVSSHEDCSDANADGHFVGQRALAECEDRIFKEKDAELNRLYKQIYRDLAADSARQNLLVKAERKWIAARDSECKQLADDEDVIGSTRDYVLVKCSAEKTAERTGQLKAPDPLKNSN